MEELDKIEEGSREIALLEDNGEVAAEPMAVLEPVHVPRSPSRRR